MNKKTFIPKIKDDGLIYISMNKGDNLTIIIP